MALFPLGSGSSRSLSRITACYGWRSCPFGAVGLATGLRLFGE